MSVRLTVAIPTRGRPESLNRTIRALLSGIRWPDEIVISEQRTAAPGATTLPAVPAHVGLVHLRTDGLGVSRSRNDAIEAATGDFVAFLDDDMVPEPDWLAAMVVEWERVWREGPVLITGPIDGPDVGGTGRAAMRVPGTRRLAGRRVWHGEPRSADVLYGGHFGAPREVFDRLGPRPFDERLGPGTPFPAAEDADFGWRVLAAGIPVVYAPEVRARHVTDKSTGAARYWSYGIGFGGAAAKHIRAGWRPARRLFLRALGTTSGKALRAAVSLRPAEASGRALAVVGMLVGLYRWSGAARRSAREQLR